MQKAETESQVVQSPSEASSEARVLDLRTRAPGPAFILIVPGWAVRGVGLFLLAASAMTMAYLLSGCATTPLPNIPPVVTDPYTRPDPVAEPGRAQVIKGWLPEYTAFIAAKVPASLLAVKKIDFCPNYNAMTDEGKRQAWATFVQGIALPESNYDRTCRFKEPGMYDKQGRQVYSEGLLQLSYQDGPNYGSHAPACGRFNRTADEGKPLGQRSILDAYNNLECGLQIMTRLMERYNDAEGSVAALGKYWSTIRRGKCKARKFIRENTSCGQEPDGC